MLRRHKSTGIIRRKSSSNPISHQSTDPEVSRQHAQMAAMLAFARAEERYRADDRHEPEQSRTKSIQAVKRRHSVRFIGTHNTTTKYNTGHPFGQAMPIDTQAIAMTTNTPVPAIYRPPSRSSSVGKGSLGRATTINLTTVNNAFDEIYTQDDDVVSTPSSYRRIRRSKSMLSPFRPSSTYHISGSPDRLKNFTSGRNPSLRSYQSQSRLTQRGIRVKQSMGDFQATSGDRQLNLSNHNNDVVQIARDRFFAQARQERLEKQHSLHFRSSGPSRKKSFRKSLRHTSQSSSTNSYGLPTSFTNDEVTSKKSTLKLVARKASQSVRTSLRKYFSRSKDEPVEIPNQQVLAKETHVDQDFGHYQKEHDLYMLAEEKTPFSAVSVHTPSSHNPDVLKLHTESVKSLWSAQSQVTGLTDEKSRVTSWDSTVTNTMSSHTAHLQGNQIQLQASFVNRENRLPESSSSLQQSPKSMQAHVLTHKESALPTQVAHAVPGPIDSARVYSALIKRIDGRKPSAQQEKDGGLGGQGTSVSVAAPQRIAHKARSQATIRRVSTDDTTKSISDSARSRTTMGTSKIIVDKAQRSQKRNQRENCSDLDMLSAKMLETPGRIVPEKSRASNKDNMPHQSWILNDQRTSNREFTSLGNGPAPQDIAIRAEPVLPELRPLRESRSTFFGGTSTVPISRTPSPFRRALADVRREIVIPPANHRNPLLSSNIQFFNGTNCGKDDPERYSESVYSRTTGGHPQGLEASEHTSERLEAGNYPLAPGEVTIIDRATYRPTIPVRGAHKSPSSSGSVEWKNWMSSEIAKLERLKENNNPARPVNYALPTMPKSFYTAHVRENTRIYDDDMDNDHDLSSTRSSGGLEQTQPKLQVMPTLRPILKNRSTSSLNEQSALIEKYKGTNMSIPSPPPPPPPMPSGVSRIPLRSMPSKASIRSAPVTKVHEHLDLPLSNIANFSQNKQNVLRKRSHSTATLSGAIASKNSRDSVHDPLPANTQSVESRKPIMGTSPLPKNQLELNHSHSKADFLSQEAHSKNGEQGDDIYGVGGTGLLEAIVMSSVPELDIGEAQKLGSKKMVDMFLSSRRQRIIGTSDDGSGRAFL